MKIGIWIAKIRILTVFQLTIYLADAVVSHLEMFEFLVIVHVFVRAFFVVLLFYVCQFFEDLLALLI